MKKFIAILLAMMLVLLNVAALADEEPKTANILAENDKVGVTATPPVTLTITKSFSTVGDTALVPAHTIHFNVVPDHTTDPAGRTFPETLTIDPVTIVEGQTSGDAAEGNIGAADLTIKLPAYTETGVYWYKVYETDEHVAGVTYTYPETAPLYLKVTVYNDNGTLKLGGVALRPTADDGKTVDEETGEISYDLTSKIDDVNNTYTAGELVIKKTVDGNMGDYTKDFVFDVTFTSKGYKYNETTEVANEDGTTTTTTEEKTGNEMVKSTITVKDTGKAGAKFNDAAITDKTVLSSDEWSGEKKVTVTLKHDQEVTFSNIPSDVTYTVVERDYASDGYTTEDNSTGTDSKTDRTVNGTIASSKESAEFTNTKEETPDTGIALETLPFVLLMGIALVGVVALRRREEY